MVDSFANRAQREPLVHDLIVPRGLVVGVEQHVGMGFDESGHERRARQIDEARSGCGNTCSGSRGLDARHPGFAKSLRDDPRAAVKRIRSAKELPLVYWTAASWGLAISTSKDNPELIADQPIVEALIDRTLEIDEGFENGAAHAFLINYEPNRPGGKGDPLERSRKHFERAVELSHGELAAPFVAMAETVSVQKQDRAEFKSLLERALAIDPDAKPEWRLENMVMQRRARWLLARGDELFVE